MSRVMAICGKGGAGKTTLAALLSRLTLERLNIRVLIIDADPTGGLSMALALPVKVTVNDLRKEIIAGAQKKSTASRELAEAIDYLLLESLTEYRNLAFLAVGRPEEEGCFCQVNAFLRRSIEYLSSKFDLTIIDAEAGVEQINRRVIGRVDNLLLVSDLSRKGLQVAETICCLAPAFMDSPECGLILNRIRSEKELQYILADQKLPLSLIGWLPEDETISRYDAEAKSFLDLTACPSLQAAAAIADSVLQSKV